MDSMGHRLVERNVLAFSYFPENPYDTKQKPSYGYQIELMTKNSKYGIRLKTQTQKKTI